MPTDIAAGLILAQLEQQGKPPGYDLVPWQEQPDRLSSSGTSATDGATADHRIIDIEEPGSERAQNGGVPDTGLQYLQPRPWMNVALAAHYMKFASASYGWPLHVYSNLLTGACSLCKNCRLVKGRPSCFNLRQ